MNFAPADGPGEDGGRVHRRQIAAAANSALRGETHNTGVLSVPAGVTDVTLTDPRMGAEKVVLLSATDNVAADLHPWIDRSSIVKGSVIVRFTHPGGADCSFDYVIVGTQRFGA